ncbi:MAG: PolyA polymerase [Candidatus Giovannonibacteria bacterium GW2011_GWA2_45_21]|uniref:PolyA polymerase n=1 Tax=Candidatus Giovannonibacteria bacterium GW2011_GWA2_45_21 TaxID=1618649 RepID=A0A0G1Q7C4_9BACT|nr:MAG: PolyA polymerase [Candidatus Giovannonibacteria bacterium GW2011_GWA2_45_21]
MTIPKEVRETIKALNDAGFEAYAVGGCVRDFILGREPYDWDITTNAKPEEIGKLFKKSVYENEFGTVAINTESADPKLKIIEITTYRVEEKYTDKRHPDSVKFTKKLEDDLSRRDFTVNAMALEIQNSKFKIQNDNSKFKIVDPFGGQDDIKNKIIRTVGNPDERFNEDALRLMRAARFAVQLGFNIEEKTAEAIRKNSGDLVAISKERIRDEFSKIIMTERAKTGIEMLCDFDLLKHIMPELEEGWGVGQNKHHIYTIWEHNIRSLDWAATHGYKLENRVASLLHDVGKPRTKKGDGPDSTFYNHEVVGAKMAAKILERLKFPKKFIEKVVLLVRYHLFYYNVEEVTENSVRRLVRNVGPENMDDLLEVRIADRKGSGVPKAEPYKLRHLRAVIEKVSHDPISVKMLKINGDILMKELKIGPGHKIGYMLNILLDEVLDEPKKNTLEHLMARAGELNKRPTAELEKMYKIAQTKTREVAEEEFRSIKKKYYVS